ncbi:uncharacterized protein LOC143618406 [Bidens hawaiensis]|uniref:uncharacterized protein LOC143618406 n=1 Tax=Bidens hawaiensis TaxID=980011 RepID=UPI00404B2748
MGMDWLSCNQAKVACAEKLICIPLQSGETLIIQAEKLDCNVKIVSCMKAYELLRKQCYAFLAHVVEKKSEGKNIQDIPAIKEYPEVFPDDLLGLPSSRQFEFRIDLIPGATPVAKSTYRLPPSEMQELSRQIQDLLNKGFIRPSSSPWGAPFIFVKGKDGSFRMCID